MIVYHGTNTNFDEINLEKSKDNRDFGKGFYTTSLFEQAFHWAENQFLRYKGEGCFVKSCRTNGGTPHNFDIVIGPVANDNTMRTIALYIAGIYTTSQAIEQLRFFKTNNQISFHTEKSLSCLKFLETREIR